ncbi:MAG: head-tail connector protein [Patescibacteria group bacterium]|nr:head-tail connector protein [Patescibacteria group bacterium]
MVAATNQPEADRLLSFHIQRAEGLRNDRGIFESHCEEVAAYAMPMHRNTFLSHGWTMPYQKKTDKQFDPTATIAALRFAAVMESLLTPQAQTWHRLVPHDPMLKQNRQVREYLERVNDLLYRYRNRPAANFVAQMQLVYLGLGLYGNGSIFVDSHESGDGLRYRNIHLGEIYFSEDHQGRIDTFYRFFKMRAQEAVDRYGDALPDSIKKAAANPIMGKDEYVKYDFLHCVFPRSDYDPVRLDAKGMPYASLHIALNDRKLVRESGYRSFPCPIGRYMQAPGEIYGRGPAMLVLPGIKVLNEEKKALIKQAHRALDPVLLVHDDGVLPPTVRSGATISGGVNADGRPLVQPLLPGNLAAGENAMELERQAINDAFLISLFQILLKTPQMTATEVMERMREKGMLISPTVGRQNTELLGPMIERELEVLSMQGKLPPPPPIFQQAGLAYAVEYDSPMSRMQRAENASGFMRSLDTAINFARETGDMSALDWFNIDVAMPALQDINGAPVSWTSTPEQVAAKRQARAEAQQQKQAVENAAGISNAMETVGSLAKTSQE